MAQKQKKGGITIANIIAMVGIVLLLVFSFMGYSYQSGGELGWDVVKAVGVAAFTALLLWFLVKAKGAENYLDNWKKAEFAALAVYIIFAVTSTLFLGGLMHFFVINDQKDKIKEYAKADLDKIDAMFAEYKEFEEEALSITGTGLDNATRRGQICDEALNRFMVDKSIEHTQDSAETFVEIQKNALIKTGYSALFDAYKIQRDEIANAVDNWSVMRIPFNAKLIGELAERASEELTKLSNSAQLPKVVLDESTGKYTLGDKQCKTFAIDGESLQFVKALKSTTGFSFTALALAALIHFLILFNYIVAYRTSTLGISKYSEEDGGRVLNC